MRQPTGTITIKLVVSGSSKPLQGQVAFFRMPDAILLRVKRANSHGNVNVQLISGHYELVAACSGYKPLWRIPVTVIDDKVTRLEMPLDSA